GVEIKPKCILALVVRSFGELPVLRLHSSSRQKPAAPLLRSCSGLRSKALLLTLTRANLCERKSYLFWKANSPLPCVCSQGDHFQFLGELKLSKCTSAPPVPKQRKI
uniref:Uncharacterized protein n=1 Tax=Terrapene triunguis TaxID=2587831 RepID=A0A674HW51_9SAUR